MAAAESELLNDLVADRYAVDLTRPLPHAGGGLPAFAALDRRASVHAHLMALQVARDAPARADALKLLAGETAEGLMPPLAHGNGPSIGGEGTYFVICPAPPGPPLAANLRPWPEAALLEQVLRPVATTLGVLQGHDLTHRGIRLNNLFHAGANSGVVLGAAWAAPPAMHQPALFEPPYSAICHPAGRGEGSIADDVYALGVVLITLALGRLPMADQTDAAIIQRKLEFGSFAAIAGEEKLPALIADLARGMLAEDPDHRTPLPLLLDPSAARGRRVATRPPRRAQRPLPIGRINVSEARGLAYAIAAEPEAAMHALTSGAAMAWLRRGLGDANLAVRLEELVRFRDGGIKEGSEESAAALMAAVAVIDPLAPLCWRGLSVWPDGIGATLASALPGDPGTLGLLEEMVKCEAPASWAMFRAERNDILTARQAGRIQRTALQIRGIAGGITRLAYLLNPLLPCGSPLMMGRWVVRAADLLPALEAAAEQNFPAELIDGHVAAFIATRGDRRFDRDLAALGGKPAGRALAQIRLLSDLQAKFSPQPLLRLARRVADMAGPLLLEWHNRTKRAAMGEHLDKLAGAGMLAPMLALIEDPGGRSADSEGAAKAAEELARIDHELASIKHGDNARNLLAARIGQETAAGLGLVAAAMALILAAFG